MHYSEQRENDRINASNNVSADTGNNSARKTQVTLPYSSSINQHLNITWHLDEIVKKSGVDLVKKMKGDF